MFTILFALASGGAADAQSPIPNNDPVVCERRLAPNLGSRIGSKKICMRRSDWTEEGRRARQTAQELQLKGLGHKFESPPAGRPQ